MKRAAKARFRRRYPKAFCIQARTMGGGHIYAVEMNRMVVAKGPTAALAWRFACLKKGL